MKRAWAVAADRRTRQSEGQGHCYWRPSPCASAVGWQQARGRTRCREGTRQGLGKGRESQEGADLILARFVIHHHHGAAAPQLPQRIHNRVPVVGRPRPEKVWERSGQRVCVCVCGGDKKKKRKDLSFSLVCRVSAAPPPVWPVSASSYHGGSVLLLPSAAAGSAAACAACRVGREGGGGEGARQRKTSL